jgi:hypothetical protein
MIKDHQELLERYYTETYSNIWERSTQIDVDLKELDLAVNNYAVRNNLDAAFVHNEKILDWQDKSVTRRKIRYFQSPSKLWYFHIQADNNEIIAPSEAYTTKEAMMDTLEKYFPNWEIVEDNGKV